VIERIDQFVKRHQMLEPGDRVAAAVSGGADSVALLEALLELRERLGVELVVAHFNHRLRGAESEADAQFVSELAKRHGLPFFCESAEVAAEARRRRSNLESVARELRYGFLRSLVDRGEARKVATGHTADDQAETVLARFLRGSGTRGLAGIFPVVDGWLVRPLLAERRDAVRAWLQARGVGWREDSSNLDLRLTRNRLRAEALPLLEGYNPRLVEHLSAIAEVFRDEEAYWRQRAEKLLAEVSGEPLPYGRGSDYSRGSDSLQNRAANVSERSPAPNVNLPLACFVQLSRAEQRHLLRAALERAGHRHRLELAHIEALRRLALAGQSGQRVELPGVEVLRVFDFLEIRAAARRVPAGYEYRVQVPGACVIRATGTRLVFNLVGGGCGEQGYNEKEESLADLDAVQNPLIVRNWRPGDRYESPTGTGAKKVKALLLERRIPAEQRRLWPVVLSGERIVWVRGFPVARSFRAAPSSAVGLLIREEVLSDGEAPNPPE